MRPVIVVLTINQNMDVFQAKDNIAVLCKDLHTVSLGNENIYKIKSTLQYLLYVATCFNQSSRLILNLERRVRWLHPI